MPKLASPLRYPGGKLRLANYIKLILRNNNLIGGVYVEPFAGGSGVALDLLFSGYVSQIIINDIDPCVYAFWYSVLNYSDEFCEKISSTKVDVTEWKIQKEILNAKDSSDLLELGFATFFLNRTNRSGILSAGVIGGKNQNGNWKIDARYNKERLIKRIEEVAKYRERITLYGLDVRELIREHLVNLPDKSLTYLDPPYFKKGQMLYMNALKPDDHVLIKHCIESYLSAKWIVSYDDADEIKQLYATYRQSIHALHYSASASYTGSEVLIFNDELNVPILDNPFRLTDKNYLVEISKKNHIQLTNRF